MKTERWTRVVFIAAATGLSLHGQSSTETIPLPLTSPRAIEPGKIVPLTASEKLTQALKNSLGPGSIINRAALAGFDHVRDDPDEWPGNLEGYGMRMGDRMGRLAIRNAFQVAADVAFKTEPRYDRCDCVGFKDRSWHAVRRVIIARKDNGGEMIGVARLTGAFATPWVADQWQPDRLNTTPRKFRSGALFLAGRAGSNMIKEFWPEIRRSIPIKKFRGKEPSGPIDN